MKEKDEFDYDEAEDETQWYHIWRKEWRIILFS